MTKSHDVMVSLATCYHMLVPDLKFSQRALECAEAAERITTEDGGEGAWLVELLRRQRKMEEEKERGRGLLKERFHKCCLKMPQYTQVALMPLYSLVPRSFV